jgi:hypothetical protein
LEKATADGHAQVIEQRLSHLPLRLYAPTRLGIHNLAERLGVQADALTNQFGCSPSRNWALRAGLPVAQEVAQFCAKLSQACLLRGEALSWEIFIPRRLAGVELLIHARLQFERSEVPHAMYLLLDGGGGTVWMWARHLRYLDVWARRSPEGFPPLLVLSFSEARALSLLALGQMLCPSVVMMASADREIALGTNPMQARWWILHQHSDEEEAWQAATVDPFDEFRKENESLQEVHRVWPTDVLLKRASAKRTGVADGDSSPSADLVDEATLQAMESLTDEQMQVLDFICLHSGCPDSALQSWLAMNDATTRVALDRLLALGLVSCYTYVPPINRQHDAQKIQPTEMYSATERAALAWWLRQACPGAEAFASRYLRAAADHLRRAAHTLTVFAFFEQLQRQAAAWSRVERKVDAPAGDVNDGEMPYFEVEAFDDDVTASTSYMLDGNPKRWAPDAYGVLRQGTARTRFWLEVDGSSAGRAHGCAEVWERKLGSLCGYCASEKWRIAHAALPDLLIVTQDHRIYPLVADALSTAVAAFQIHSPQVFVASAAAISQQGPMGKVWRAAHDIHQSGFVQALVQSQEDK